MTLSQAVVKRIYEYCNQRNITLNKLSTICGMTQSTLDNVVKRENCSPKVSTIKKICDGLEITMAEFFDTDYFNELEQEIR